MGCIQNPTPSTDLPPWLSQILFAGVPVSYVGPFFFCFQSPFTAFLLLHTEIFFFSSLFPLQNFLLLKNEFYSSFIKYSKRLFHRIFFSKCQHYSIFLCVPSTWKIKNFPTCFAVILCSGCIPLVHIRNLKVIMSQFLESMEDTTLEIE